MTSQEVQYMVLGQRQFWSQGIIKVLTFWPKLISFMQFLELLLRQFMLTGRCPMAIYKVHILSQFLNWVIDGLKELVWNEHQFALNLPF